MRKVLKYMMWVAVVILVGMAILNPRPSEFKEYAKGYGNPNIFLYRRQTNYIIFSIYVKEREAFEERYLGIAGNFFALADEH